MEQQDRQKFAMYSPLTLAYVGDGIYEILVRTYLVQQENLPVNKLHRRAKGFVAACSQSAYMEYLLPLLTEEEEGVYKRGRNAKSHTTAKNMTLADYKRATGMEALFGYLHLTGQKERIEELFSVVCSHYEEVAAHLEQGEHKE